MTWIVEFEIDNSVKLELIGKFKSDYLITSIIDG